MTQTRTESPVYRFPEACDYLKVGETTMRGLVAKGEILVVRVGRSVRFTQWSLDNYLRSNEASNAN